jgi:hypothetical protein
VAVAPGNVSLPSEQRVDHALRWLSGHGSWLLVLDNLTAPAHAVGLLDRVRTGTILITSRQSMGWRGVTTLPLDVMSPGESGELLARVVLADWPGADLTDADRLCKELGWLPLAVEQAGAYLAQTRTTPTACLDLLRRYPMRLFTATTDDATYKCRCAAGPEARRACLIAADVVGGDRYASLLGEAL